jgi:PKD repeat protein
MPVTLHSVASSRTRLATGAVLLLSAVLPWSGNETPQFLTRGPYLQSASATGITLVCRTNTPAAVTLRFGERAGPPWEGEITSPLDTTHVFELERLRPETSYVYELAAGERAMTAGEEYTFRTSPPAQSRVPFRFLAFGDSGTGTLPQFDVADQIDRTLPRPAFVLMLGDLVYEDGERELYDAKLFTPYAPLLRSTAMWPSLGNHDVHTEDGAPYFENFYLPTQSGASGHPSGTENYYSFDHGMAHFACVDSQNSDSAPGSEMATWLEDDLTDAHARGKRWIVVYIHKPPYSRGTHDSTREPDLIRLHDDLVPLFDAEDVDLVLSGHSHGYERSFLIQNDDILQSDPASYTKVDSSDGTLYVVTGCAGNTGSGPLDHPFMAVSYGQVFGFSQFDVSWSELRGRFVERDGRTTDLFTVRKAPETSAPRVAAIEARAVDRLALVFDEPVQSGASDPAHYSLDPPAAVLGATMQSDRSTVALDTSKLDSNRAQALEVRGVADTDGHLVDQRVLFALPEDTGASRSAVVPRGSEWRYRDGATPPPPDWMDPAFDDRDWKLGRAGFGYGDEDDTTELTEMQGVHASVYARTSFLVDEPALVTALVLEISYDDGFVAFLNGAEVARAKVPAPQTNTTLASTGHEARGFEKFDLGSRRSLLVAGRNVLAVEGHNAALDGDDFTLHPALETSVAGSGGPPHAKLDVEVRTANVPALIRFSGADSFDADGPLASLSWDFGDGSLGATGTEIEHVYVRTGTFVATLIARDSDGLESVAQTSIRIHDQGAAPRASLVAETLEVAPGESVKFDAQGSIDPDGGPLTYHWDFADPARDLIDSGEPAPTFALSEVGFHPVTLVVTDDEGSSDTQSITITVATGQAPTARFSSRTFPGEPLRLAFTDLSTGDVSYWSWEFGDGSFSGEKAPAHLYAAAGDYPVRLTVGGPSGTDDTETNVSVGRPAGSSGGGCTIAPEGRARGGDPLPWAVIALVLVLLQRRRGPVHGRRA